MMPAIFLVETRVAAQLCFGVGAHRSQLETEESFSAISNPLVPEHRRPRRLGANRGREQRHQRRAQDDANRGNDNVDQSFGDGLPAKTRYAGQSFDLARRISDGQRRAHSKSAVQYRRMFQDSRNVFGRTDDDDRFPSCLRAVNEPQSVCSSFRRRSPVNKIRNGCHGFGHPSSGWTCFVHMREFQTRVGSNCLAATSRPQ